MEFWREIAAFPNYEVSNLGNVRNKKTGKWLKQYLSPYCEYLYINPRKDGKQRIVSVHRVTAIAWVPNPENKPQVNHLDGNKLNNRASNFAWATPSENMLHCYQTGLKTYKPLHNKGKFGDQHNRSISVLIDGIQYQSISEASQKTGIPISSIHYHLNSKKKRRPRRVHSNETTFQLKSIT